MFVFSISTFGVLPLVFILDKTDLNPKAIRPFKNLLSDNRREKSAEVYQ